MPKPAVSFALASALTVFAVAACSSKDANANIASTDPVTSSVQANSKTCVDLIACCGKVKDQGTRKLCTDAYAKKKGNDTDCELAYDAFASYCDPENAPKPVPKPKPMPKPRSAP